MEGSQQCTPPPLPAQWSEERRVVQGKGVEERGIKEEKTGATGGEVTGSADGNHVQPSSPFTEEDLTTPTHHHHHPISQWTETSARPPAWPRPP